MYFIHQCIFRCKCPDASRPAWKRKKYPKGLPDDSFDRARRPARAPRRRLDVQKLGERADARRFPPLGTFVDVGTHRLHVIHKGPSSGPTVVIEQGAGEPCVFWWSIVERVAGFASVCTYDRAGLGSSRRRALRAYAARQRARAPHTARACANPGPVHPRRTLVRRVDREAVRSGLSARRCRPRARRHARGRHPFPTRRATDVPALPADARPHDVRGALRHFAARREAPAPGGLVVAPGDPRAHRSGWPIAGVLSRQ